MLSTITQSRADFISVLEAAYAAESDAERWAKGLVAATHGTLADPNGVSMVVVAHDATCVNKDVLVMAGSVESHRSVLRQARPLVVALEATTFRASYYPGRPVMMQ